MISNAPLSDLAPHSQVLGAMLQLADKGLNQGASGNVSVRTGSGLLISPSGIAPERLKPTDPVALSLSGKQISGSIKPSTEWPMHTAIYEARPDINAIVHCHSTFATTLACARQTIPSFHYMVAMAGGTDIPCTPYALFGSEKLANFTAEALQSRNACLMANHGQMAIGKTLEDAINLAAEVEELAKQYWATLQLGTVNLLNESEMKEVIEKFSSYGKQN